MKTPQFPSASIGDVNYTHYLPYPVAYIQNRFLYHRSQQAAINSVYSVRRMMYAANDSSLWGVVQWATTVAVSDGFTVD